MRDARRILTTFAPHRAQSRLAKGPLNQLFSQFLEIEFVYIKTNKIRILGRGVFSRGRGAKGARETPGFCWEMPPPRILKKNGKRRIKGEKSGNIQKRYYFSKC